MKSGRLPVGPGHGLAPQLSLRPVLAERGGTTLRGHDVLERRYDDLAACERWLGALRPTVSALLINLTGAVA